MPRPLENPGPEAPDARELARLREYFRERSRAPEPILPGPLPEPFRSRAGLPLPVRPRALILDVYGTLLVSGAGEVGTAAEAPASGTSGLESALREFGVRESAAVFEERVQAEILRDHAARRAEGLPYPEVDGAAILARITGRDLPKARLLGAAREAALNPAGPMPGARELLERARSLGLGLGIVSNAQYYTVPALEAAFCMNLGDLGFSEDLCVWSWRLGRAKPDPELFRLLARRLAARGIQPSEAVYIGNDLLNDVAPARAEGFRTALFAGDARSLRLRAGDSRTEGLVPDTALLSFRDALAACRLDSRGSP